jgi:aminopeptidase N
LNLSKGDVEVHWFIFLTLMVGFVPRNLLYRDKTDIKNPHVSVRSRDFDILHYRLELTIDATNDSIFGRNHVTLTSLTPNLSSFYLHLADLTVDSVVSQNGALTFTHQDTTLTIDLNAPLQQGETTTVAVFYHGRPVEGGGVFGGGLTFTDSLIFADNEPFGAKRWIPCLDLPDDKATSELLIKVPENYDVVANGVLVETTDSSGWSTYHWMENYPIATYLIVFAASPYFVKGDTFYVSDGDTMPINFWVFPRAEGMAREKFAHTPHMIEAFSQFFAPYPFLSEKYAHVQAPIGGAMENQTNTFINMDAGWGEDWDWVVAHELSHQWWGDWVTLGTWKDIWLNEGFATYCEALYYGYRDGENAYMQYVKDYIIDYFLEIEDYFDWPIYDPDYLFTPVTYEKAAAVLHMLRHVVGDSTFFEILRSYGNQFAYGNAVTTDFIAVCESLSGMDLSWFFDEWVYQIGHPNYHYTWSEDQISGDTFSITLTIQQTQQSEGYPIFKMPIDVAVVLENGDTVIEVIWDSTENEVHQLTVIGRPIDLILDPYTWIMKEASGAHGVAETPSAGEEPLRLRIFGSPVEDHLTLQVDIFEEKKATLKIYDVMGRLLSLYRWFPPHKGLNTIELDVNGLPAGIYFVQLRIANRDKTQPFVKIR